LDIFANLRHKMIDEQLRARGIQDQNVLDAMGTVPRERFLPPEYRDLAYQDRALPHSCGQTVSQPYMVAVMTEALQLQPTDRVLEIGTGSGYQTAILSPLASAIFSVERIKEMSDSAYGALSELSCDNVRLRVGDGTVGWPEEAPFHAILVTAGAPGVPESLLTQLAVGGRLVIPVGDRSIQELFRVTRTKEGHETEKLLSCRFVPLIGEEGWEAR
jgi:protein-L-isoaspartate(D-aspartate) O-methyltransferase